VYTELIWWEVCRSAYRRWSPCIVRQRRTAHSWVDTCPWTSDEDDQSSAWSRRRISSSPADRTRTHLPHSRHVTVTSSFRHHHVDRSKDRWRQPLHFGDV